MEKLKLKVPKAVCGDTLLSGGDFFNHDDGGART